MGELRPIDRIRKRIEKFKAAGQWEKVCRELKILVGFNNKEPELHRQLGEAYQMANQGLAAVTELLSAARLYEENGSFDKAIAVLKKVLKLKPSLMDIHLRLGDLYAKEGKIPSAIEHYQALNTYFTELGARDEALDIYKKLSELQPNNLIIHRKLAEMYEKEGYKSQAILEYRSLAKKMKKIGLDSEVIGLLSKIVFLDPTRAEDHFELIKTYYKLAQFDDAMIETKELIKNNPKYSKAYLLLGDILVERNEPSRAVKAYLKYITSHPDELGILKKIITLQLEINNKKQALESAKKLIDQYLISGNKASADAVLKEFDEVKGDEIEYQELKIQLLRKLNKSEQLTLEIEKLIQLYTTDGQTEKAEQLKLFLESNELPEKVQQFLPHREDDKLYTKKPFILDQIAPLNNLKSDDTGLSIVIKEASKTEVSSEKDDSSGAIFISAAIPRKQDKKMQISPPGELEINVGKTLYDMGLYHEAISEFTRVSENQTLASKAFAWIGFCYRALGNIEKAGEVFLKITDPAVRSNIEKNGFFKFDKD